MQALYKNLRIRRLVSRDEQEVAGYLEVLQPVFENYAEMPVRESVLLQLHRDLLRHSDKDIGHLGRYKIGANRVEAKDAGENLVGIVFDPTPPYLVPTEMQDLCGWYQWAVAETFKHPLVLIANFIFEYLAIHPFQDGNGRTSRIVTNLMRAERPEACGGQNAVGLYQEGRSKQRPYPMCPSRFIMLCDTKM